MTSAPNEDGLPVGAATRERPNESRARTAREVTTDVAKVCLAGPSLDILGGQAVQLARLHNRLSGIPGIEVMFLPMNPKLPGPLRLLQRVKYVRTVATSIGYWILLLTRVRRFDVIHAFAPSYWAFLLGPAPAILVARLFGRGALLNYHSGEAEDHLRNWRSAVPLARLADRIVVPPGYLSEVFARFGLPAQAIHNFVDADAIPHRERTTLRPVFLSNRNFESHYNVSCCIRAFARVQEKIPSASLTVAGYGSERAMLEELTQTLRLRNVRFTGRVPPSEMATLLNEADILLNSPDIDNMPLSLIEAQAAGLPVVSTSAGGIPYLVKDGETGLLVNPGDDEALARAALRLLEEPGLARRVSGAARATYLERYTWASVRDDWVRLYRDMASARRQLHPAGA
jgi:glycosyltransferase involved in cell wall biosynthesis